MQNNLSLSICIFAHNEERLLPQCLAALDNAAINQDYAVHVIENGSSDATYSVANAFAALDARLHIHQLSLSDKANAWNNYVHRIAPSSNHHIFLDGDIRPSPASFKLLSIALESSPQAYAAAALPAAGRSRKSWATRTLRYKYINGNLYALTQTAINKFREKQIFFPFGAVGEDGILTYLLRTDLKGGHDDSHTERITVASGAFFEFDSLSATTRDFNTYSNRLKRYSERYFQKQLLYRRLKARGVGAMPEHISEIYDDESLSALKPRLNPIYYFIDRKTLQKLRQRTKAP